MSKSIFKMYGHLIFSTKNRVGFLDDTLRKDVHSYMAAIIKNQGSPFVHIGGTENHVHVLFDIGKTNLTTKIIGIVKKDSSKFIKNANIKYKDFYWQKGYGLYSVSPSAKNKVINYIDTQIDHHKKMSFKEEYLAYLKKYNIEYEEKYIWD